MTWDRSSYNKTTTSLSVVLTRDIFLHVRTMQKNITSPRQHSPTMTVSAGPSEMSSPHKNHRRYKTSDATQSKDTPKTTTPRARSPWFVVFFKNEPHHHQANFVTFFVMERRDGNSTFFLLVSCFNSANNLFYVSTLLPQILCCLLLFLVPPSCPVLEELGDRIK